MMIIASYVIIGWSIRVFIKIKLMGTSLYDIIKGNTTKVDIYRRIIGCFSVTKNGGFGCFWEFIPNTLFFLRQPIPLLLRNHWRTLFMLIGICLDHINRGVYAKGYLIFFIGEMFNLIEIHHDLYPNLRSRLNSCHGLLQPIEVVHNIVHRP